MIALARIIEPGYFTQLSFLSSFAARAFFMSQTASKVKSGSSERISCAVTIGPSCVRRSVTRMRCPARRTMDAIRSAPADGLPSMTWIELIA